MLSVLAPSSEKELFSKSKYGGDSQESAWVLLGHDFTDFDSTHANLERMVREGESQNADIVTARVRILNKAFINDIIFK